MKQLQWMSKSWWILAVAIFSALSPSFGQDCRPPTATWSRSNSATRIVIAGNSAQLPYSQIANAINSGANMWNSSPCQAAGLAYPWFQMQSSGADSRVSNVAHGRPFSQKWL